MFAQSMRLLLDAEGAEGNGGVVAPPPEPKPAPTPAPAQGGTVTLSQSDLQALLAAQTRLREVEAANAEALRLERVRAEEALAKEGRAKEALTAREQRAREEADALQATIGTLTQGLHGFVKVSAINAALAGRTDLAEGAAGHLAPLLEGKLQVAPDPAAPGGFKVHTADFKPADAFLAEFLSDPKNKLFLKATSGGGAGSQGTGHDGGQARAKGGVAGAVGGGVAADGSVTLPSNWNEMSLDQKTIWSMKARQDAGKHNPYAGAGIPRRGGM